MLAFRSELSSFASLELALRQAACPWFGVDLDPVALLRDEWEADEFFSRLGPLVRHVRARDAVGGAGRRTKPAVVGQGSVPWEAVLGNLDQTGYQGWMTLDPVELTDRVGAAVAGVKYLRSVIE
ncbi:MAG TPA: TIM barrel protein [Tepidisphaeraceae bacterium]